MTKKVNIWKIDQKKADTFMLIKNDIWKDENNTRKNDRKTSDKVSDRTIVKEKKRKSKENKQRKRAIMWRVKKTKKEKHM